MLHVDPESYFTEILSDTGVELQQQNVIIRKEQSIITRDLGNNLKRNTDSSQNLKKFTEGFNKFIQDKDNFQKALCNSFYVKLGDNDNIKVPQENLLRLLLNVEVLQSSIIEIILEEITVQISNEDVDSGKLRLLLNGLRYLSGVQDANGLTTKLLDLLEIANFACQLEILNSLPEILPDLSYETAVEHLSKFLESNGELAGAILDCLNAFCLSNELRTKVQGYILNNLLVSCKNDVFPILFEFVLIDCKAENIHGILMKCRNCLDNIMRSDSLPKNLTTNTSGLITECRESVYTESTCSQANLVKSNKNADTIKALVLNKIYTCSIVPKQLFESWISLINGISVHTEHKGIDLLLLFVLYSTTSARKKVVESLFKRRLKSGLFKISLLEVFFQKYVSAPFLAEYATSMIEIGVALLKHNDINFMEFGSQLITLTFCCELTNQMQRQEILYNLLLLIGVSDNKTVETVLGLLVDLSKNKKISNHTMQLMELLTKIDEYDLLAVKQIFCIICEILFNQDEEDKFADLKGELHMLIRKQLTSSKKSLKLRGIVSAIVMVKYLACLQEAQNSFDISQESLAIADIPRKASQDAANLIELVSTCSSVSPEYMSVYYDSLAYMLITCENIDKWFLTWLSETITTDFQDIFVTEINSDTINGVSVKAQYSLNASEEVDVPISINIGLFSLQEKPTVLFLSPLFRLLRLLHYQLDTGNLSSIDALLGSGILMPVINDIKDFDLEYLGLIANSVYHCINWLREIISAFVTQKNKKLRQKVIKRLDHIIELEKLLQEIMTVIPEHKLPTTYLTSGTVPSNAGQFAASPNKSPRQSKKFKNAGNEPKSTQTATKTVGSKKVVKEKNINFREIDIDIILLLKYPLQIDDYEAPLAQSTQTTPTTQNQTKITMKQFEFLMQDFIQKLTILTKNINLKSSHLLPINTIDLITDSVKLLPCINRHFGTISEMLNKPEDDSDMDLDNLNSTDADILKQNFHLVLECYSLIFGWTGFQNTKNLPLLKDCLKSLQPDDGPELNSVNRLLITFSTKLTTFADQCIYLPSAVNLIKILQALYKINMSLEIKKQIVTVSGKLLSKTWDKGRSGNFKGKLYINNLEILTQAYLNGANVKTLCSLISILQTQVPNLIHKTDHLQVLQSFDKTNYYVLYNCICITLLEHVKSEVNSLTNNQHLILWKMTALSMQGLMTIAKIHEIKSILVCFLKKSLGVLKIFLTHGVPILEIMLRSQTDKVLEIFKTMQTSTRFLHHLCCYSKLNKDTSLIAFVPQFRLTLETLIYKVKGALIANDCSAAFWMGNLRNKNIDGEDICTQNSVESEESNEANDLPLDDQMEEDMDKESDGSISEEDN